jgi:NAD(P)-dependent dehydrogenase (short-subunit alcohol dehydrogenase family)
MIEKTSTIYNFNQQCIIVTGGAQGIGQAITQRLVASNATVAIWDIDAKASAQMKEQLGRSVETFEADISNEASVSAAMANTIDWSNAVHGLVNSAGIAGPNAPLADYPIDAWRQIMQINVDGTFLTNRAVVPLLQAQGYGRIVNIASVAGKEGNPNASAYSASKAAVIAITKSLGKELAKTDIAVNCVTPAAARTRIFDQMSQEHIDYMLSKIPRARFVELDETAAMVCWLLSSENSFTTGSVFDLSGGRATY